MSSSITNKPLPAPHGINGSKFWAVIIGIDDYKTSPLHGCVSDAEMVAEYLRKDLRVPESNMQLLLGPLSLLSPEIKESTESEIKSVSPCCGFVVESTDERISKPTRGNIVNAILDLSTNPKIQNGDNIIIYFAGHGARYKCAEYSPYKETPAALGTIEALCPMDRGAEPTASAKTPNTDVDDSKSSVKASDPQIPDISDREINTILAQIARNKGNHITLIIDCCHSASLTRAPMSQEGVRSIPSLPLSSIANMFSAADEALKHIDGYQPISEGTWRSNMDSHIALAACKDYEYAKEVEGTQGKNGLNGVFTQALIPALKSADLNDESMTYYKLLTTLPVNDNQHPVIAGKHKNSRLWFQFPPHASMEEERPAEMMRCLDELESNDYGMSGIDSVEVFDENNARAFTQDAISLSLSSVKDLDTLYQLRVLTLSATLPLSSNREESTIGTTPASGSAPYLAVPEYTIQSTYAETVIINSLVDNAVRCLPRKMNAWYKLQHHQK
ncbi:caspase domain-containing protein [Armillaria novae-zelandiae]|uniref:Caspase domain-containing protein n=1 Tax=Armillaria novae-zelandiae TaxID=153914 RepID=A0AA39NTG5_9AGAR|nr:caspase domain-containing protein [Armillaria novae-zelandiae]